MKELINKLQVINCFYNHKVEIDGKCYSHECMLNAIEELKQKIKINGCKVYTSLEIQLYKSKNKFV
jgi:hypothetical protein